MGRNYIKGDWIPAATESRAGIALGYYVDCDTALCLDDLPGPAGDWAAGKYTGWEGFEGWESPGAIFNDTESDSVTHCGTCGRVLKHDLTAEGCESITESLERALQDGDIGNAIEQWMDAYGGSIAGWAPVDLPAEYLATFTQHYAIAMLWANTSVRPGENDDAYDTPAEPSWWMNGADDQRAVSAFDAADQASIREDCEAFIRDNWLDLALLPREYGSHPDAGSNAAAAGHDFALTRNHHGAGFWDRGLGELGDRLTTAAHAFGESSAWCHADDDPASDHLAHLD
jgi:hypothetical protein